MKKLFIAVFSLTVALGLGISDADAAKRLGGGKSVGMQREAVAPKPAAPAQAAPAPAHQPAPAAPTATQPQPKRNWLGPLAGLAAGLGIAALLSHFGLGEGMANILMLMLLAMAAVFVFKLLFRRKQEPEAAPLQYAGNTGAPLPSEPAPAPQYGSAAPAAAAAPATAATPAAPTIPAGFDVDGFLRVAKLNFVRLQAANDAGNLADLREFVSPEIFAEIKLQLEERGKTAQQTDVVTLNASLLEVTTDGARHIASVHFSGMIREDANAPAAAFEEVWHLSKPVDGSTGWVVAGIQQLA